MMICIMQWYINEQQIAQIAWRQGDLPFKKYTLVKKLLVGSNCHENKENTLLILYILARVGMLLNRKTANIAR